MTTVYIADDHPLWQQILCELLRAEGFTVVGTALDGQQAWRDIPTLRPDLAIIDLHMPRKNGDVVVKQLRQYRLPTRYILLADSEDQAEALKILESGANGFLLKSEESDSLVQGIKDVAEGGSAMSPKTMEIVLDGVRKRGGSYGFTNREEEVLSLIEDSNAEIARKLDMAIETVKTHLRHIYKKLDVGTRREAIVKLIREGRLK